MLMLRHKAKYLAPLLALVLSLSLGMVSPNSEAAAKSADLFDLYQNMPTVQKSLSMMALAGNTINVPSQVATIQGAINVATNGDTIVVAPGTYGGGINWENKYLTIKSSNGPASTIIDGGGTMRNIVVSNMAYSGGLLSSLSGFTIRNGRGGAGGAGGVTLVNHADIILENNIIENNTVPNMTNTSAPCSGDSGAGVLINISSNALLRFNTIRNNRAAFLGGGIYVVGQSNPAIYNNTISDNAADSLITSCNPYSSAGGILVGQSSAPRIIKNTISNNRATGQGGGISYVANGTGWFEQNTVTGNTAGIGGGVEMETGGSGPFIANNVIANNVAVNNAGYMAAGSGGGVAIYDRSTPVIKNNQIYGNTALRYGAGVVIAENSNSKLYSNKIYSNKLTADETQYCGAGMYIAGATTNVVNNLFYKNEAYVGAGICLQDNSVTTLMHNTIAYNLNRQAVSGNMFGAGIQSINAISSAFVQNNIISNNGHISSNNAFQVFEQAKKLRLVSNLITNTGLGLYFNYNTNGVNSAAALNANDGFIDADLNVDGDPAFVNAGADNYDITPNSGAINNGYNIGASGEDIANRGRFAPVDIGAYEYYATPVLKTPIYRFYSQLFGRHFYTSFIDERNSLVQNYMPFYFAYEGQAYDAYATAAAGTTPLYRFFNLKNSSHFYTIGEGEKNNLINNFPNDYHYEGIAFYVIAPSNGSCGGPGSVYRFYNKSKDFHFFTANTAERDVLIANFPNEWKYIGVGYCTPYASS